MVLDKLGSSLRGTLDKIKSAIFVDDKLINELVKDLQRALLQSDTNVQLVFKLGKAIKERSKEETPKSISKRDHLIKIVYEELTTFLGEETSELKIDKSPTILMLVGLFGAGKTTTAGKLANFYKKRGKKVAVVQTDTWRPAAYEQLEQTAKSINVDFYGDKEAKTPESVYNKYKVALKEKYDLIIVDTAGRDALSDELVTELEALHTAVQADEKILVIQADLGQAAQKQAQMFHDVVKVTGVIVTKIEGTAKAGGALSACAVTGAPIKFIGVGEKVDDLEVFHPKRFVGQLLGMGDLETLLEKASEAFKMENAEDMAGRFMKGNFNLNDLYGQMESMKKMGSFQKIMGLIPGMSNLKLPKEALDVQEGKLKKWKFIMDSMTNNEKENPDTINPNRIDRIVAGSGTSTRQVRELLKQYRQSKKMMKMMKGSMGDMAGGKADDKKMQKMMAKMQRKMKR